MPVENKFTRWWMGPERLQEYDAKERVIQREQEAQEALAGISPHVAALLAQRGSEPPRVGESVMQLPELRAKLAGLQGQYGDTGVGQNIAGLDKRLSDFQQQQADARRQEVTNKATSQLAYQLEGSKSPEDQRQAMLLNYFRNTGQFDKLGELTGGIGEQAQAIGEERFKQEGRMELEGERHRGSMDLEEQKHKNRKELSVMERMARLEDAKNEAEKTDANLELKLRKAFLSDPVVKDFQTIDSQFRGMSKVWNDYAKLDDSGRNKQSKIAIDQVIVNTLNKMLDPDSVVRESEFARTAEGQAILERAKGYLPKLQAGGVGLTDKERAEIVKTAETLYSAARGQFRKTRDDYRDLMDGYNVRTDKILGSFGSEQMEAVDIGSSSVPQKRPAQTSTYETLRSKYGY